MRYDEKSRHCQSKENGDWEKRWNFKRISPEQLAAAVIRDLVQDLPNR